MPGGEYERIWWKWKAVKGRGSFLFKYLCVPTFFTPISSYLQKQHWERPQQIIIINNLIASNTDLRRLILWSDKIKTMETWSRPNEISMLCNCFHRPIAFWSHNRYCTTLYIIIQHLEVGYSKHNSGLCRLNSGLCRLKLVRANVCLICLGKSEKLWNSVICPPN